MTHFDDRLRRSNLTDGPTEFEVQNGECRRADSAKLSARLEWMSAQIDDLIFTRGRQELTDLERRARLSELGAQIEDIAHKTSSALERVQEIGRSVSQHELRLQSVEAQACPIPPSTSDVHITQACLDETGIVTVGAQSPVPPAISLGVPRPVVNSVRNKSPAEVKPKVSETEGSSHLQIGLLMEKAPLQAIGLDPSVW